MGWSTREIANLAGTTVNTVRHYHRSGLLEEPERMTNGYKQYGARHLVRLLQIRRLRDLGVPLAQIEAVGFTQGENPSQALLAIDADLAVTIERLQRARGEIRAILEGSSATDVPPGFEDIAGRLSASDRSLMLVYSQLYDDQAMADLKGMVESGTDAGSAEFEALTPDASEADRQRIAETIAPELLQHLADHPWLLAQRTHLTRNPRDAKEAFDAVMSELYNEAQLDVMARVQLIAAAAQEASATAQQSDAATRDET